MHIFHLCYHRQMPSQIIVIGAGPAGEAAASAIKRLDKTAVVTLIEKEFAGGLCLNKGCIPSKTLLEHVHKLTSAGKTFEWDELQALKTDVVQGIRSQLETNHAVDFLASRGEHDDGDSP